MSKKLYDNLYKVIKVNSGAISANDGVFTEIMDLQIPRGFAARIRKVQFLDALNSDQIDQEFCSMYGALVLDPDDETQYQIPTFEVDHDVLCDFHHEYSKFQDGTPDGISFVHNQETVRDFPEELDVVTVRNIRCNIVGNGFKVDGSAQPQAYCTVYFSYEKISADLYAKLLGIS